MWNIRFLSSARGELYTVPRGIAAVVTDALERLRLEPIPSNSVPIPDIENAYQIDVAGYTIEYELLEQDQIILILAVR